jgi:hypothetical protein
MKAAAPMNIFAGSVEMLGGGLVSSAGIWLLTLSGSEWLVLAFFILYGGILFIGGLNRFRQGFTLQQQGEAPSRLQKAEDRLDELERLKRRDMVTPEEYAAKRQEILKDL